MLAFIVHIAHNFYYPQKLLSTLRARYPSASRRLRADGAAIYSYL